MITFKILNNTKQKVPVDYLNVATGLWHRNYTQHRFGYGVNVGVVNNATMVMFGGAPIDVVGESSDVDARVLLSTLWKYDNVQLLTCEQNTNCR